MAASELETLVEAAGVPVSGFPHGGVIFVKDDTADHAYVVRAGRVEIREAGGVIGNVGPGEIFGEVAMIDRGPRSASAVAVGPTELYTIDHVTFDRLVRDNPVFAAAIMRDMARRLRATNARSRQPSALPIVNAPPRRA